MQTTHGGELPSKRALLLIGLVTILGWHGVARAHGIPVDIAFWGDFEPGAVDCQRALSRAASRCAQRVIRAHLACLTGAAAPPSCPADAWEAELQHAEERAAESVAAACTDLGQLQSLRFMDVAEVLKDVGIACRELDGFVSATIYGPMLPSNDAAARECARQTASVSEKLLWYSVRVQQRVLDRMAARPLSPATKRTQLARAAQRIAQARERGRQRLEATCDEATFRALYRRRPARVLQTIAQRSDCFAERIYIQSTITCPIAVCGNGIAELGETCDDGNDEDGDGCSSTCQRSGL